jgi:hypothetical protein
MSWSVIDHKMVGIRAGFNDWELKTLEREFSQITNRISRVKNSARSLRGILFIDMAYALARHRDWLKTPVFFALFVEFLQLDHGLPRTDSEYLVHEMIEAATELGLARSRSICDDDREFLTWAYVCAAGANDDDALEAELGLGTAVLKKLRDGFQALEKLDSHTFVPEYDSMLAAIVLELSHECKLTPWAMDYHRLRYALLAAVGDDAQPYILEESIPSIFTALAAIGRGDRTALQDRPSLADSLVAASILSLEVSSRKTKTQGHTLTDFGARLTANFVAEEGCGEDVQLQFKKLSGRWQECIIQRSKDISFEFLNSLAVDGINQLSPEVIEAVIARMIRTDASRVNGDLVRSMLANARMAWHKAAIMRALRTGRPSRELLDAVAAELSASISPGVRLAAGALLEAWTD